MSVLTLLRTRPHFRSWAIASGVSMFGTAISSVVLPILVFDATGSVAQTGLLFALRVVPYLLFGLIAGPVADRADRKRLIVAGNVVEGLLVASIPVANAFGVLTVGHIYVVGLLAATAFVFSDAAVFGAVPALVEDHELAAANGFLSTLGSTAEVVGPALGGLLAATIGAGNAVWFDAASFLFAAAVLARIPGAFRRERSSVTGSIAAHALRGLRFIRGHRTVATLIGTGFGNSFSFGVVLGLIVPYATLQLGLGSEDVRTGALYSATGIGSLVAGLVFARLFAVDRIAWLSPGSMAVSAASVVGLAAMGWWVGALPLYALFNCAVGTTIVTGITYRQLVSPEDVRSSVNVVGRMISWGGQPFGAATGAFVADAVSVRAAYAMAATTMAFTATVTRVLLRRAAR